MVTKRKRFSVTARLVVEVEEDENSDIVKGLLRDILEEDWRVENMVFIGEPILLKDDNPQAVEVNRYIPDQVFSLRRQWEAREAHDDAMKMEARENVDYRAAVEFWRRIGEDSINPNEADMGTTNRD